jgi:hypothetical protein
MIRTAILSLVLYDSETDLSPQGRNIDLGYFGEYLEVAEVWIKLLNEKFHNLYSAPNIGVIEQMRTRWLVHITRMEELRNAYKILVGNPQTPRGI